MRYQLRGLISILGLGIIYFCAGKLGLSLAYFNASASAVWPATGIAFAALLLWGSRLWPGVFIGAFLVNITTQGSAATSCAIATGNTLEALMAAWAVRRFASGSKVFQRARNIFKFVLFAPVLSTIVSATLGVTSLTLGGFARWDDYLRIWFTWWLGDAVGDLIVAPLLVLWFTQPLPQLKPQAVLEAFGLLLSLILGTYLMFLLDTPASSEYMMVLPLLWAAYRFGTRGVVTSAFIVSGIALGGTLNGTGAFAHASANESLLHLQSFMGTIAMAALVLASVIAEGKVAERRLQAQEAISRILAESPALKQAAEKILQVLCERANWDWGALWMIDRSVNALCCVRAWHERSIAAPRLEAETRKLRYPPDVGLPGRVWSTGKAIWIANATADSNFPRAPLALEDGLQGAFGFPVRLGERILGVVECYSREVREPDDGFLEMATDVGAQIGQFVERKLAEDLLLESEERLRAVVETAVDGIITIDERGVIDTANPAAERIFNYPAVEMIGQSIGMLMPEPYRSELNADIVNYLRMGIGTVIGVTREVLGLRRDGTSFPLDLSVSETLVGGRRIFTGLLRDISERKQAEELLRGAKDELAKINGELEIRVQQRTADLAAANTALTKTLEEQRQLEEQLRQSQKMESIGTLAGGIAHDFNNILNIIRGYAMLLGQQPLAAQPLVKESLKVIEQEVSRGAAVVQELMTVARKSETRLLRIDVNEIVLNLSQLIKTFPKTVEIVLDLERRRLPVLADPNKLVQALLNICVNAQDAMPSGGTLSIVTKAYATSHAVGGPVTDGPNGSVCISVSDTGTGIPVEVRGRIFEPFFTTKGVGKGTGLGLAIVYGIVKEHNGRLEIDSEVGRGTTIRVYLPMLSSEDLSDHTATDSTKTALVSSNGRGTVLVVEDEEQLLGLLKYSLSRAGYEVLLAMDGEQAIEMYRGFQSKIDIVLLDLGLPKIPGKDVIANLLERNPDVNIIVTTGYLAADLKSELSKAGVKKYINKPYLMDDVLGTLASLVGV